MNHKTCYSVCFSASNWLPPCHLFLRKDNNQLPPSHNLFRKASNLFRTTSNSFRNTRFVFHQDNNKKEQMLLKKRFIALRQFSANFPALFISTFNFPPLQRKPKKIKRASKAPLGFRADNVLNKKVLCINIGSRASGNST
jgi:hypothetical protein